MREFFTTGCDSCRKKRPIDFPEASCGACAPRCPRKHRWSVRFPRLRILRHRHSQARRRWDRQRFPRSLRSGFYKTPRLRRSELTYLIHGVLQAHFNNHYFTLTQKSPLHGYQSFIQLYGRQGPRFPFTGQSSQKYFDLFLRLFPPIHGKPSVYG